MGGNTKGSKQALVRVVWSQPSRRQYPVGVKDQMYLRRKRKIWSLLKNRCGIHDTSQVFATHVEEDLNEHGLLKDALVPWWYWKAMLKTCSVHCGDGFIPAI